tara:strand:- start:5188 stop:5388 length:201 start_codon:yes stop_codon:yes gene_type:complete
MFYIVRNINTIKNYLKISKVEDKIILGRWGYTKNIEELNKKVYLANHDHCGPCGYVNKEITSLFNS